MKNKFLILLLALTTALLSCGTVNYVKAPAKTVPIRSQLEADVYGSYITINTTDSMVYEGELIGLRNDTIAVLSDKIIMIERNQVSSARVIVHMPNSYKGAGIALMGISGLVMVHAGEFGGAPLALGLSGILTNGIGLASAQETENKKINYFDWSEGWEKVMLYSRFPKGVPSTINLEELKPRKE